MFFNNWFGERGQHTVVLLLACLGDKTGVLNFLFGRRSIWSINRYENKITISSRQKKWRFRHLKWQLRTFFFVHSTPPNTKYNYKRDKFSNPMENLIWRYGKEQNKKLKIPDATLLTSQDCQIYPFVPSNRAPSNQTNQLS